VKDCDIIITGGADEDHKKDEAANQSRSQGERMRAGQAREEKRICSRWEANAKDYCIFV